MVYFNYFSLLEDKMKDPLIFVRYGSTHARRKRKGRDLGFNAGSFHSPPASKGFYAMPLKFQELFLVGSLSMTQPDSFSKKKDLPDNYYNKKLREIRRTFILKDEDLIWSHFGEIAKHNEVIEISGSWILTTVSYYKKLLAKQSVKDRARTIKIKSPDSKIGINEVPKGTGWVSADHYEVFIPKTI